MKIRENADAVLIRFERGDELISGLIDLFSLDNSKSGTFTVIGATTSIELGFYTLEKKEYHWREFIGEFEVTGGVGNISYFEGKPVVHLHSTIADAEFNAFGGHVRKLVVGATCEVTIRFHENTLEREFIPEIGLNLWKL
jgi:predicted DNA-binding protein with PD1-like motif